MFGLFKRKKFSIACPMCGRSYTLSFDPTQITEFDYEYWPNSGLVGRQACDFCKTEMSIALSKAGEARAYDEKWESARKEFDEKLEAIFDQIDEVEIQLSSDEKNQGLIKKLASLEGKKSKLEDSFENKESKYYDRQAKWEEKWREKLE